ncbi:hypothetical protein BaRGS_00013748 [Batillaria attramentaria]|uniref:Uncharacterized protein n=1 Tax=Batillaria attramentaria TaxID=370345 RepID=A0ABD0L752_9CAEN
MRTFNSAMHVLVKHTCPGHVQRTSLECLLRNVNDHRSTLWSRTASICVHNDWVPCSSSKSFKAMIKEKGFSLNTFISSTRHNTEVAPLQTNTIIRIDTTGYRGGLFKRRFIYIQSITHFTTALVALHYHTCTRFTDDNLKHDYSQKNKKF